MSCNRILWVYLFAIAPCIAVSADKARTCSKDDAIAAETQEAAKTWKDFYRSYLRYAQCDDGSVAEAFSNSVAMLLAEHWDRITDLNSLTTAHRSYGAFVLRHTDVTMSFDQAQAIKRSATDKCPGDAKLLCERILHRMSEFK